ncbi:MAG: ATP-binding cassette domain-containing protein, partial [Acidobacteriota bacterium]
GERGSTLSGGQRQRICLARTIIKRPSILILDEPTAAIDPESSALIQQAIERLQRGKTTLVISHQFAAMESFNQIIVLKDGRVVELGTHAQLVARRGYYYELYRLQTGLPPAAPPPTIKPPSPQSEYEQMRITQTFKRPTIHRPMV